MSKKKKMTMEADPQAAVDPESAEQPTEAPGQEGAESSAAENTGEAAESQKPAAEAENPLAKELEEAKKTAESYLNMAQRVQADFENYRRRNQNSIRESFDDGAAAFAGTLLPVLDNLERALQAAAESPDESLRSGVEMICRQFTEVLEKRGITEIDCLGKPFDPNLENAIMQGAPEDGEPGTVCQVFQKGYRMKDKLLRAAMVKVVPN